MMEMIMEDKPNKKTREPLHRVLDLRETTGKNIFIKGESFQ